MSSILKALKKLENEKTAHRPESLKINSDILRGESLRRNSTSGLVFAAFLLFAGGSIATYLYMKPDSSPFVDATTKTTKMSGIARPDKPKPPTAVRANTDIKTEELPKAVEIVPAKNHIINRPIPPKLQKQIAATKFAPIKTPVPLEQHKSDQQKKISTTTATQLPMASVTVPKLRVNGIADQDLSSESVAVVNGVLVSVGATIEGVRVEAIQKDRVRFSHKGDNFEIFLGKSNR